MKFMNTVDFLFKWSNIFHYGFVFKLIKKLSLKSMLSQETYLHYETFQSLVSR